MQSLHFFYLHFVPISVYSQKHLSIHCTLNQPNKHTFRSKKEINPLLNLVYASMRTKSECHREKNNNLLSVCCSNFGIATNKIGTHLTYKILLHHLQWETRPNVYSTINQITSKECVYVKCGFADVDFSRFPRVSMTFVNWIRTQFAPTQRERECFCFYLLINACMLFAYTGNR